MSLRMIVSRAPGAVGGRRPESQHPEVYQCLLVQRIVAKRRYTSQRSVWGSLIFESQMKERGCDDWVSYVAFPMPVIPVSITCYPLHQALVDHDHTRTIQVRSQ